LLQVCIILNFLWSWLKFLQFLQRGKNNFKSGLPHVANHFLSQARLGSYVFAQSPHKKTEKSGSLYRQFLTFLLDSKQQNASSKLNFFPHLKHFNAYPKFLGVIFLLLIIHCGIACILFRFIFFPFRFIFFVSITIFQRINL
jgi:hypothetical protein